MMQASTLQGNKGPLSISLFGWVLPRFSGHFKEVRD